MFVQKWNQTFVRQVEQPEASVKRIIYDQMKIRSRRWWRWPGTMKMQCECISHPHPAYAYFSLSRTPLCIRIRATEQGSLSLWSSGASTYKFEYDKFRLGSGVWAAEWQVVYIISVELAVGWKGNWHLILRIWERAKIATSYGCRVSKKTKAHRCTPRKRN